MVANFTFYLLFFYKNEFGIKYLKKVDMPLKNILRLQYLFFSLMNECHSRKNPRY